MKTGSRILRPQIIFPFLLVCYLWTFLQGWIPKWGASWVFSGIGAIYGLHYVLKYHIKIDYFLSLLFFSVVLVINILAGDVYWNPLKAFYEISLLIWTSSMLIYVKSSNDKKTMNSIIKTTIFVIVIITLCSFVIEHYYPNAIRSSAEALFHQNDYSSIKQLSRWGGSNYYLPHAIPIILPAIILGIKKPDYRIKHKLFLFIFLILCFGLVWISGSFTALLLSILAILLSCLISIAPLKYNLTKILFFILVIPFITDEYFLMMLLEFAERLVGEGNAFSSKIIEAQNSLRFNEIEGDASIRLDFYSKSISSGVENIVWGTDSTIGNHSVIIDHFASLGLIGFLPFIFFIFRVLKITYNIIPSSMSSIYLLGVLLGFSMLLLKNMSCGELWIFLFALLPLLILKFSSNK